MNFQFDRTSLRWILFVAAFIAVIGMTGLNLYSLYALHDKSLEEVQKNRDSQLLELTENVRSRMTNVVRELWKVDMEQVNRNIGSSTIPQELKSQIDITAADPLYSQIYMIFPPQDVCESQESILQYNKSNGFFEQIDSYPDFVCDGVGIARTRMKLLEKEYKWNTKVFFDTHRSMTVVLVDNDDHKVLAYLLYEIDTDVLVNDIITPQMEELCSSNDETSMTIWLHDWTKNEVISTNDPSVTFVRDDIQIIQRFPGVLDNWNLKATYNNTPVSLASSRSLIRNLAVLIVTVILLLGSLIVIWIIANREREFAIRQAGFLANVTHELKTPLAVMQAAGENLADGRVTDEARLRNYGKHIYEETVRLKNMIEKLLDVARSESGNVVANAKTHNIGALTEKWIESHRQHIEDKGFTLNLKINNGENNVLIDKDHYETILSNLVQNALKYSPNEKFVDVTVHCTKTECSLSVRDKGTGIPAKSVKKIFTKFYRVEDAMTANTKGHGLGLSIVEHLVHLNSGKIVVQSTLGKGSTFTVTFPKSIKEHSKQPVTQPRKEPAYDS